MCQQLLAQTAPQCESSHGFPRFATTMGRRKRAFLEDDLDSSEGSDENDLDGQAFEDDDPDARAERSLFEDPYQRNKRRRVGGFDDDDEGFGGRPVAKEKKLHYSQ